MLKEGTVPINYCAAEFYTLQALELKAKKLDPFKKSHERFQMDLQSYKERFEQNFSLALRDYLVYACFGEARNSRGKCASFVLDIPEGNRSSAAVEAQNYTPKSIARVTKRLFDYCDWSDGYGGESWGRIAKAIDMYEELPKVSFIDHCVDLSHNGGTMFDKTSYRIFTVVDHYKLFLDRKSDAQQPDDLLRAVHEFECHIGLSFMTQDLISRALMLGLVTDYTYTLLTTGDCVGRTVNHFLEEFMPTKWGEKDLPHNIQPNHNWCNDCGHSIDDCECKSWCPDCDHTESECICNECTICGDHIDACECCHDCENEGYECTCDDEAEEECFVCGYAIELCECKNDSNESVNSKFFTHEESVVKIFNVRSNIKIKKEQESEEAPF